MIEIKVNGDICQLIKNGKIRELKEDYLKVVMCAVEGFSGDIGVSREDSLTFLYNIILEIYKDDETEIKEV